MTTTTLEDISEWFDEGVKKNCSHLFVVCDTYAAENFPVFVLEGENVDEKRRFYDGVNANRIMEIYNLHDDKVKQLEEPRAIHV